VALRHYTNVVLLEVEMALIFQAGQQFFDSNGLPVAAGTLTFYDSGTTNYRAIYTDADMQTEADNPYTLDASGRMSQNIYGTGNFTVILKKSTGATVFSRDEVFGWSITDPATESIIPASDDSIALGSALKRFASLYAVDAILTTATATTITATGNISGADLTASGKVLVGSTRQIVSGTGSPESAVTAPMGSLYLRTDGASDTTLYVKTSGSGNTGWQAVYTNVLTASTTWDVGSLADGAGETKSGITVTGAALGDFVDASLSVDLQGMLLTAWVSSANTVAARIQNETGSGPIDLASATLRVRVRKA
jgi:hypothetical protein